MEGFAVAEGVWKMNNERKLQSAEKYKELGRKCFQNRDVENAFRHFAQGIKCLILINPKTASCSMLDQKKVLLPLLQNNTANCHMTKGNWVHAIDLCNSVLQTEPENIKALYRRGTAFMELQEYEKSASDLYAAQAVEPENLAIKAKLERLTYRLKNYNKKSADAMKKLFY